MIYEVGKMWWLYDLWILSEYSVIYEQYKPTIDQYTKQTHIALVITKWLIIEY